MTGFLKSSLWKSCAVVVVVVVFETKFTFETMYMWIKALIQHIFLWLSHPKKFTLEIMYNSLLFFENMFWKSCAADFFKQNLAMLAM